MGLSGSVSKKLKQINNLSESSLSSHEDGSGEGEVWPDKGNIQKYNREHINAFVPMLLSPLILSASDYSSSKKTGTDFFSCLNLLKFDTRRIDQTVPDSR